MNQREMTVIRSNRRTFGLEIRKTTLIVRVPLRATNQQIAEFLQKHEDWIGKHLKKAQERQTRLAQVPVLTEDELRALAEQALQVIPERVRYYAPIIGVTYGRITIRNQKTRWGSCSSKGNLNFNCLLLLTPPQVVNSVVVHELCHRKEMNHSERFYAQVLRVMPDYPRWDGWLKAHGEELRMRLGE